MATAVLAATVLDDRSSVEGPGWASAGRRKATLGRVASTTDGTASGIPTDSTATMGVGSWAWSWMAGLGGGTAVDCGSMSAPTCSGMATGAERTTGWCCCTGSMAAGAGDTAAPGSGCGTTDGPTVSGTGAMTDGDPSAGSVAAGADAAARDGGATDGATGAGTLAAGTGDDDATGAGTLAAGTGDAAA